MISGQNFAANTCQEHQSREIHSSQVKPWHTCKSFASLSLRLSGTPDFRISGFPEIRTPGKPEFRIPGNPDFRISRVSRFPRIRIFRISRFPHIRESAFAGRLHLPGRALQASAFGCNLKSCVNFGSDVVRHLFHCRPASPCAPPFLPLHILLI